MTILPLLYLIALSKATLFWSDDLSHPPDPSNWTLAYHNFSGNFSALSSDPSCTIGGGNCWEITPHFEAVTTVPINTNGCLSCYLYYSWSKVGNGSGKCQILGNGAQVASIADISQDLPSQGKLMSELTSLEITLVAWSSSESNFTCQFADFSISGTTGAPTKHPNTHAPTTPTDAPTQQPTTHTPTQQLTNDTDCAWIEPVSSITGLLYPVPSGSCHSDGTQSDRIYESYYCVSPTEMVHKEYTSSYCLESHESKSQSFDHTQAAFNCNTTQSCTHVDFREYEQCNYTWATSYKNHKYVTNTCTNTPSAGNTMIECLSDFDGFTINRFIDTECSEPDGAPDIPRECSHDYSEGCGQVISDQINQCSYALWTNVGLPVSEGECMVYSDTSLKPDCFEQSPKMNLYNSSKSIYGGCDEYITTHSADYVPSLESSIYCGGAESCGGDRLAVEGAGGCHPNGTLVSDNHTSSYIILNLCLHTHSGSMYVRCFNDSNLEIEYFTDGLCNYKWYTDVISAGCGSEWAWSFHCNDAFDPDVAYVITDVNCPWVLIDDPQPVSPHICINDIHLRQRRSAGKYECLDHRRIRFTNYTDILCTVPDQSFEFGEWGSCPGCGPYFAYDASDNGRGFSFDCSWYDKYNESHCNWLSYRSYEDGCDDNDVPIIDPMDRSSYRNRQMIRDVCIRRYDYSRMITCEDDEIYFQMYSDRNCQIEDGSPNTWGPSRCDFNISCDATALDTIPPLASIATPAPSDNPTNEPTVCTDYNILISSNDGADMVDPMEISRFFEWDIVDNITNNTIYYKDISDTTIVVDNVDSSALFVSCENANSCKSSTIKILDSYIDLINITCLNEESCVSMVLSIYDLSADLISINCIGVESCKSAQINIFANTDTDYISRVSLLCNSSNACSNMLFTIHDIDVNNISIVCLSSDSCAESQIVSNTGGLGLSMHCMEAYSCLSLSIQSMDIASMIYYNMEVICYKDYACDGLSLVASSYVITTLIMHAFSDNIYIRHNDTNQLNIICNNANDRRFIKYDTMQLKTMRHLLELSRSEYSNYRLPCESIEVNCTTNEYFPKLCDMGYELDRSNYNISNIMKLRDDGVDCLWMEVSELFAPICVGNCYNNITIYTYNQTMDLDIYVDKTNHTEAEILDVCTRRLSTVNVTTDTLSQMDSIFEYILASQFNPYEIYHVLQGPDTVLRDGLFELVCESFDVAKIQTFISMQSGIDDEESFNALFTDKSTFIQEAEKLLSAYFGIRVNIVRVYNITKLKGLPISSVILIVVAVVFVVLLISYFIYKLYLKNTFMQITNPIILNIGIGIYDDEPTEPDFNGHVSDLIGVEKDIENVESLFGDKMNFKVLPKDVQVKWTKKELLQLLKTKAKYLAQHTHIYDGLMVIISSHGWKDYIITSDYKMIHKHDVARIFSASHQKVISNRSVPRLFIFDCCDGMNDRQGFREDDEDEEDDGKVDKGMDEQDEEVVSVKRERQMSNPWSGYEKNPDHKVLIIHGANKDFQSKIDSKVGSYMITEFVSKIEKNDEIGDFCSVKNKKKLGDIVEEMQNELEHKGKQLVRFEHYNGTDKILFVQNKNENNTDHTDTDDDGKVELATVVKVKSASKAD